MSVTQEGNILLAVQLNSKVIEYSPTGTCLCEIRCLETGISSPRHALKIANDKFVISFGSILGLRQGICIFTDKPMKTYDFKAAGKGSQDLNVPLQLCAYSNEGILVLDAGSGRILQLNSALEFHKELLSWKDGLRYPWRMCLDETNGLLFVANNYYDFDTRQKHGELLLLRL